MPQPSVPIPPQLCPACGYIHDRASEINNRDATPVEGSLSICIECGAVNEFDRDLRLRAFPDWMKHVTHQQAVDIAQSIAFIRRRGPMRKREKPS